VSSQRNGTPLRELTQSGVINQTPVLVATSEGKKQVRFDSQKKEESSDIIEVSAHGDQVVS
jgi:hypothetical protein